jgi:hypothetical protein
MAEPRVSSQSSLLPTGTAGSTWQHHDVIIWDNPAVHHCRPKEMGTAPRRLRRQPLDGWYTTDGVLDWRETVVCTRPPRS